MKNVQQLILAASAMPEGMFPGMPRRQGQPGLHQHRTPSKYVPHVGKEQLAKMERRGQGI